MLDNEKQPNTEVITPDKARVMLNQAQEILQKDIQERIERCNFKIQKVLDEESCTLDIQMVLSVRGIEPRVNIIPKVQQG